jgi:hypothetical protein
MDIVERLREKKRTITSDEVFADRFEAADEIEKLRKLNVDQTRQLFESDQKYKQLVDKVRVWMKEGE